MITKSTTNCRDKNLHPKARKAKLTNMRRITRLSGERLNKQLEFVLGATKTGLDIIDQNFNLLYVNPSWQKIYGDPSEKKCYEYFMGKNKVCENCGAAEALLTKKNTVREELLVKENNRAIEVTSIPYKGAGNRWLVAEINVDITERKKMTELLRQSEERYRALYEASRDAIMTLEPSSWRFTAGNASTVKMFSAKDEQEFISKTPYDLSPEHQPDGRASREKALEMIDTAMKAGSNYFEWTHKRINGQTFPATVLLNRIKLDDKIFVQATVRDITREKLAEKEKQIALEMKTAADIKSRFASMVSHELRAPMGSIKEGINLVLEEILGKLNNKQKDMLLLAKRNADRLGRFINDVLDFKKMQSGKMVFHITKNNLNLAAKEAYDAMSVLAAKQGLLTQFYPDKSLPAFDFDADKIVHVFVNVIGNAIKHTQQGSVTIRTKKQGNLARVSVKDTGVGISEKDAKKIFLPFEQFSAERKGTTGGTGIGLAIAKEIIEAHKGEIWMESKTGKGTTFYFTLPIEPA